MKIIFLWKYLKSILILGSFIFIITTVKAADNLIDNPTKNAPWTPEKALEVKTIDAIAIAPDARSVTAVVTKVINMQQKPQWVSELWKFDLEQHRQRNLFTRPDIIAPSWVLDGTAIAFMAKAKRHIGVWLYDIKTGKNSLLVELSNDISSFQFSPNGKHCAVVTKNLDHTIIAS